MAYLSLGDIMEADLPQEEVDVPAWGGTVKVRAITAAELSRAKREATNPRTKEVDNVKLTCLIVEMGCVEPAFAPGQYKALLNRPLGPINRVAERILDLAGIGDESGEAMAGTD